MDRTSEKKLLHIAGRFYDAALDDSLWLQVLGEFSQALGGVAANIQASDPRTGQGLFGLAYGTDDPNIEEYIEHIVPIDVRLKHQLAHPECKVVYDYLHSTEQEMDRSAYYDYMRTTYGIRYVVGSHVFAAEHMDIYLALHRAPEQGHADMALIEQFTELLPHIERAFQISQKFADINTRLATASETINRLTEGILFLDHRRQVMFMNRTAEAIVAANDGLRMIGNELHAERKGDDGQLQRMLSDAIGGLARLSMETSPIMGVPRKSGALPYTVFVGPVPDIQPLFTTLRAAALVVIRDPLSMQGPPSELLVSLYGLTPTEARLATELVNGASLSHAAEVLGISKETARSHLKQVFKKTGARRQAELVRMLMAQCLPL